MSTNYINQIKDSNNITQYLADGTDTRIFTGTCDTTGENSLKLVVLDDPTNFSYSDGVKILVTFKYAENCSDEYLTIRITNVTPVVTVDLFIGTSDDYNADTYLWTDNESILFTFDADYERWRASVGMSNCIEYAINKNKADTKVRQDFITPGTGSGTVYPLLFCGTSGISSTSSRGSIAANLNNTLRYTPYGDVLIVNNLSITNNISDLFKVTTAAKSVAAINAHSYITAADWSIPAASKPSGYNLVAIVGWYGSNPRIYCQGRHIVDNDTIWCGFSNTSASNVTSSTTFTFYLLWAKATIAEST